MNLVHATGWRRGRAYSTSMSMFHVHAVPRHEGDRLQVMWQADPAPGEELDTVQERVHDARPGPRQSSEMSELVSWRALATPHASCLLPETGASASVVRTGQISTLPGSCGTNWTNLDFAGVLRRFACEPSGKVQPVAAPSASRDHRLEGNRADQPPDGTQQP